MMVIPARTHAEVDARGGDIPFEHAVGTPMRQDSPLRLSYVLTVVVQPEGR